MFFFLKKVSVNKKIAMMGAGGVLVTAVALVALAVLLSGQYNSLAQSEVDVLIDADLNHIAQGVYNLAKTADEAIQKQLDYNLNVARHVLAETGDVILAKKTLHGRSPISLATKGQRSNCP